jgi:RodZ C-terminal domain
MPPRPSFRTSTTGYDREDVDRFIRAVADERVCLQERVADLEAVLHATIEVLQARLAPHKHELDRMLITGKNPESRGESISPTPQETPRIPRDIGAERYAGVTTAMNAHLPRNRSHRLALVLVPLLVATAAVPAVWYLRVPVLNFATRGHSSHEPVNRVPTPVVRTEPEPAAAPVTTPDMRPEPPATAAEPPVGSPRPSSGLTILVTARDRCWIGATFDGQRKLERLMQRGETTILHALDEVVLKAGNAGALSLTINGLRAAPLGRQGQTVTTRITLTNYMRLTEQAQHSGRAGANGPPALGRQ